jgi:hypothetical protein
VIGRVASQFTYLPYFGGIPLRCKAMLPQHGVIADLMAWFGVRDCRFAATVACRCDARV